VISNYLPAFFVSVVAGTCVLLILDTVLYSYVFYGPTRVYNTHETRIGGLVVNWTFGQVA